jgi:hypothetical protein
MKLYILNPSAGKLQFTFRIPEQNGVRHVMIGPGQQEMVYEGSPDIVYNIVKQNERYGLIEDTDIRAKRRGFTGMLFATDRYVDIKSAKIAERQNNDALITKGDEMRKISAVAAADVVSNTVRNSQFSETSLQDTTLGLRGEDAKGDAVVINEENVVSRKG